MEDAWTVLKVLDWTTGRFERGGVDSPRLEAQVLLSHVLECDRVALYTAFDRPMEPGELATYRDLIRRRLAGEPVAYLVGEQEFWSKPFTVDSRVLIPRRDTETLIEAVLDQLADRQKPLAIADIGTGSAAIAVTLASELQQATVVATDASPGALEVARINIARHELGGRVELRSGDLLAPLSTDRFDVVVANLPYVADADMDALSAEVKQEPRSALIGGADGLDFIRRLVSGLKDHLKDDGFAALEHGFDQGAQVRHIIDEAGLGPATTRSDLGGRERVTITAHTP